MLKAGVLIPGYSGMVGGGGDFNEQLVEFSLPQHRLTGTCLKQDSAPPLC